MLPTDPSFSTCHNCQTMCCQDPSLSQLSLRQMSKEAHKRILTQTDEDHYTQHEEDEQQQF